ncbi:acetylornithine deacetylase [Candidatus Marsarchaeota G1 archaeon BE_D]|jgi:acetylornithine deacetylase|uniref:Acetylornithine deacetylase n=1 Tax=Candidatus Marsarchaeota G1 archaeon BE_D TaxID=1978156 RepID=A0A2R6AEU3_9ARCH|nr:MAG: acetylornithine deacetylase [Candidatus Marsarchaeota G1 archaeon BE_D]
MTQSITAKEVSKRVENERENIISLLRDILRIPSVTGEETEIQNYFSKYLSGLGLEVDVWEPDLDRLKNHPAFVPVKKDYKGRPNVVAVLRGSGGGKSLIFNGHVDVIPPGPREAWSVDPWGGEIINGRIYGRGAADMKSGLAAMTSAVKIIKQMGLKLKGDIILEYTVDEELSGNGTLDCVLRGYKADAGISLETSSMKIQPACIGRIWFEITIKGKPAGIQNRRMGVNAIDLAYKIKQAVEHYEALRISVLNHPLFPDKIEALPCIIGEFRAGNYPSAFPDIAVLKGSIATLPNENSDQVKTDFKKYIEEVANQDPWMKNNPPKVEYTGYFAEPSEMDIKHPILQVIKNSYTEVLNSQPVISGRTGAADIRFLNKYGNTPSLIFGPGDTLQMHATDEYVNIEDVINATKVLVKTIVDWSGVE